MKKAAFAIALVAGQLVAAAQPAFAADPGPPGAFSDPERGAFVGLRLRATVGGAEGLKARASLAAAPMGHSRVGARSHYSLGEGLELGISPGSKAELTLAGQRLDRMSLLGETTGTDRTNMSTLAKVAIVAGVVVIVGGLAFVHVVNEASCFHGGDDDDC